MNKPGVIAQHITGAAITIAIADADYPLAYPMHAAILYFEQTGDSLYDSESWPKIELRKDPKRWLACLWAGLHQEQEDEKWKSPFSISELSGLVNFGNSGEISLKMVAALTAHLPKAEPDPNAAALGEPAPGDDATKPLSPTSASSGPAPAVATGSLAPNS